MISSYTVKTGMRDEIAAVTHVDGTCRPQMIERGVYPKFWNLLNEYEKLTGSPVLMNTSLNVKGEPIVCNPHDAIKCFYDTGIQVLVLGSYILRKS
jgi:carbamoyltransferase